MATAIDRALALALDCLTAQGAPLSKHDRQVRESKHLASAIAQSISEVVCRSNDDALRLECLEALRLDEEDYPEGGGSMPPPILAGMSSVLLEALLRDWGKVPAHPVACATLSTADAPATPTGRHGKAAAAGSRRSPERGCAQGGDPQTQRQPQRQRMAPVARRERHVVMEDDADEEWLWETPEDRF